MIAAILNIKKIIPENGKSCALKISVLLIIIVQISCKKLVDIPPPPASIAESNVYTNDATAIAVLTGIYTGMNSAGPFTGNRSITLFAGLSADELTLRSGLNTIPQIFYYKNTLSATAPNAISGSEQWNPLYNHIYKCNAAIEGLSSSNANVLMPVVRQQLLGEAKFLRAFFYYYLVNLFGDVPIALGTDPKINTLLTRIPKTQVYEQIITDLKDAQQLLNANYLKEDLQQTTTERVRPTKWAATALLARTYLFAGDYASAAVQATAVINNTGLYSLPALNDAFLKNSREAIWQLQPTALNFNTQEARLFIIPPAGPSSTTPVYLSKYLLNSFETGDQRAVYGNWIDTTIFKASSTTFDTVVYPYKYKINASNLNINPETGTSNMSEYLMVLRLGEQYLIRAEARARQNNIDGAREDILVLRRRAGLSDATLTAVDQSSLLAAVLHERQVELFTEFGHRWLDLKRTGAIDAVMTVVTPVKAGGMPWQSYQQWYPLPKADLERAPNLIQNPGY